MAWRTSIRATSTGFRLRRRVNILFAFWLIASAGWIAIVGIDLCARISDQVAFSQQIGADLARIDCETGNAARCATVAAAPPGYGGSWTEVAGLFLTYGCWTLLEFALAPPAAVLAIGLVAASVARRLRRRVTLPSPASADRLEPLSAG
ncbi:MAG TPA: hypothetical protein VGD08_13770 [Stellaceae bacterium]|jgi:hypothetical protein